MSLTDGTISRIYATLYNAGALIGTYLRPTVAITEVEMGVQQGVAFNISGFQLGVTNGSSVSYLGVTNGHQVTFRGLNIETSTGGWLIEMYENSTATLGTLVPTICLNRNLNYVSDMLVYSGSTIASLGTLLLTKRIHIAGNGSANRVVSSTTLAGGIILKRNTKYVFKVTNLSGSTADLSAEFLWLEK